MGPIDFFGTPEVLAQTEITGHTLTKYRELGLVRPIRSGRLWLYTSLDIQWILRIRHWTYYEKWDLASIHLLLETRMTQCQTYRKALELILYRD